MDDVLLCNLASGSTGNCTLLATPATKVLIDAGISTRRIRGHLRELGTDIEELDGVCVTHEHGDHVRALPLLNGKHGVPLYGNAGTVQSLASKGKFRGLKWKIFTNGQPFMVGDIGFHPFSIPHDAFDPVGFIATAGKTRIGFATDIGLPTRLVRHELKGCHVLMLETNHDRILLDECERPWSTKQRIAGRQGHLSNEEAAELLRDIAGPELCRVYLSHISQACNQVELASSCIRMALKELKREDVRVEPTWPDRPSAVWRLERFMGEVAG